MRVDSPWILKKISLMSRCSERDSFCLDVMRRLNTDAPRQSQSHNTRHALLRQPDLTLKK